MKAFINSAKSILLLLFSLIVCNNAFSQVATDIWLEAECATVGGNWQEGEDTDASNGTYLTIQNGYNSQTSAPDGNTDNLISFNVDISQAGDYYLFGRIKAPSYSDDSFWLRVNGGTWVTWSAGVGSSFLWNSSPLNAIALNQGSNTIEFAYREDGALLDKLFLSSTDEAPTGVGESASNCQTTVDPFSEWLEAECATVGGNWQEGEDTEASNGTYLTIQNGYNSQTTAPDGNTDNLISFNVDISQAGDYYLFGRIKAPSYSDDSFWLRVNGGTWVTWSAGVGSSFLWNSSPLNAIALNQGSNTIEFAYREDGALLDKLFISSTDEAPTSVGEDASNCQTPLDPFAEWLEAECATVGANTSLMENTSASNGEYILFPNGLGNNYSDASTNADDHVVFTTEVVQSGTYYIFARANFPADRDNSFWVKVNDGAWETWTDDTSDFTWKKILDQSYELIAGTNTITFTYREDGVELDKLFISNTDEAPTGVGESASNCQTTVDPFSEWLEAECATIGGNWQEGEDTDASNGTYLTIQNGYNSQTTAPDGNTDNLISFNVDISQAGDYYLFGRIKAPSYSDDSFWLRVNGGTWVTWSAGVGSSFLWNSSPLNAIALNQGSNTIEFAYREDGALLDKLFISSADEAPTSVGEDASNCQTPLDPFAEWLEAECATVGANTSLMENTSASNGEYILFPNGLGNNYDTPSSSADDHVIFTTEVDVAGTYYIFARANFPADRDNSFWVKVNDGAWETWTDDTSDFTWKKILDQSYELTAGTNTITFTFREDGVELDKLFISNTDEAPTGLGEDDPNCNLSITISAEALAANLVEINWNQIDNATNYKLYRKTSNDADFVLISTLDGSKSNYQDNTTQASTIYTYKIEAVDESDEVISSHETQTTTPATSSQPSIEELYAKATSQSEVELRWHYDGPLPVTFLIERIDSDGEEISFTTTETEYIDTNLSAATTYTYRIRTQADDGTLSDYFDPQEVTTFSDATPETLTSNNHHRQFNGNIAAVKWKTRGWDAPQEKLYVFNYDQANRLTQAKYVEKVEASSAWNQKKGHYDLEGLSYDANGNIESLTRFNGQGGRRAIDILNYNYQNGGNQLASVTDASHAKEGFHDGNTSGNDYSYDLNGNLDKDKNKNILEIEYNILNLPSVIKFTDNRQIRYTYDAAGTKLRKEVEDAEGNVTTTDYIAGVQYVTDPKGTRTLEYIQHEEGRVKPKEDGGYVYHYDLKDHLGNVRLTFSSERETDNYLATMEIDNTLLAEEEKDAFDNYLELALDNRFIPSDLLDHTDTGTPEYSLHLNASSNGMIGLAKSFEVKAGDSVHMEVYGTYVQPSQPGNGSAITNIGAALAGVLMQTPGGLEMAPAIDYVGSTMYGAGPYINSDDWEDEDAPKAFLNYIFFDENFLMVDFGADQISIDALADDVTSSFDLMELDFVADQKGYLYVFFSNENPQIIDVYFDDFKIDYVHTNVIGEDDYYPFGLTQNTEKHPVSNALQYDLGYRHYDASLGRFHAPDPLGELFLDQSTYHFAANNPIKQVDVLGLGIINDVFKWFKNLFNNEAGNIQSREKPKELGDFGRAEKQDKGSQSNNQSSDQQQNGEEQSSTNPNKCSLPEVGLNVFLNQLNADQGNLSKGERQTIINRINANRSYFNDKNQVPLSPMRTDIQPNELYKTEPTRVQYMRMPGEDNPTYLGRLYLEFFEDEYSQISNFDQRIARYTQELRKVLPYSQAIMLAEFQQKSFEKFETGNFIVPTDQLSNNSNTRVSPVVTEFVATPQTDPSQVDEVHHPDEPFNPEDLVDFAGLSELDKQNMQDYIDALANASGTRIKLVITDEPLSSEERAVGFQETQEAMESGEWGGQDIILWFHYDTNSSNTEGESQVYVKYAYKKGALSIPEEYSDDASLADILDLTDKAVEHGVKASKEVTETNQLTYDNEGNVQTDVQTESTNSEPLGLLQRIGLITTMTKAVLDEVKVPEWAWDPSATGYNDIPIHILPIIAGGGDFYLEEKKEIFELVSLALTMVSNPDEAQQVIDALMNLNVAQVRDMVVKMFDDRVTVYNQGGVPAQYQGGKDVGMLTTTALQVAALAASTGAIIGAILKNGKGSLDELGDLITNDDLYDRIGRMIDEAKESSQELVKDIKENSGLKDALNQSPELVDAWKILNDARHDVRLNTDLLDKVSTLSPDLQQKVGDLYKNLQAPAGYKGKIDFIATKTIDGNSINVHYDKDGFPDFTIHSPGQEFVFESNSLTGKGSDMTAANNWANSNIGADRVQTLPNGKIKIDDIEHTWHHHQDGKSMFPVPSNIHNVTSGGFGHSGGAAIIDRGLQGLFNSPVFN